MRNRLVLGAVIAVIAVVLSMALIFKFRRVCVGGSASGSLRSAASLLVEAQGLEQKGDLAGQKALYQRLINDFPNHKDIGLWQKKSDDLNLKIIFSPVIMISSQEYQVQPQDTLTKVAKQFNTTVELIKKSNSLSSDLINPGRKLKIWTGKFSVLVDKSQNTLVLKSNEEIIKTYNVATGTNNTTPIGTFKILTKLVNPPWYKSGAIIPAGSPENILGSRWLGFDLPGYGIHGTNDSVSIGKQATAGCVRMLNADVEELYMLLPVGAELVVVD